MEDYKDISEGNDIKNQSNNFTVMNYHKIKYNSFTLLSLTLPAVDPPVDKPLKLW